METKEMKITSTAFRHEGDIPARYTCDGEDVNPPLNIEHIPEGITTMALIMEDPDAPNDIFDHWVVWNIDPVNLIEENSRPGISGKNSAGKTGYYGPCPPYDTHRYYFYFFALNTVIDIAPIADKKALKQAMEGHIIGQGKIMGHYRSNK